MHFPNGPMQLLICGILLWDVVSPLGMSTLQLGESLSAWVDRPTLAGRELACLKLQGGHCGLDAQSYQTFWV